MRRTVVRAPGSRSPVTQERLCLKKLAEDLGFRARTYPRHQRHNPRGPQQPRTDTECKQVRAQCNILGPDRDRARENCCSRGDRAHQVSAASTTGVTHSSTSRFRTGYLVAGDNVDDGQSGESAVVRSRNTSGSGRWNPQRCRSPAKKIPSFSRLPGLDHIAYSTSRNSGSYACCLEPTNAGFPWKSAARRSAFVHSDSESRCCASPVAYARSRSGN
jgi:hypothetical protein